MRRFLILLFLITIGVSTISIQAGKGEKLTKEEKVIVKGLKSSYRPKSVELKIGDDGFKYFELISKEGVHFIADSVGTIIIDPKYEYSYIIYVPKAETPKRDYFHSKWGNLREILSVPVERTFVASKNSWGRYANGETEYPSFFYNEHGELITFIAEELEKVGNTLFKVHYTDETTGMYGVYGLISADGRVIIPTKYESINPSSKYSELGNWSLSTTNDGIIRWGIFNTKDSKLVVPCQFNNVEPVEDGSFLVKLTEHDTLEVYDPFKEYKMEFADGGEKLYHQKKYRGVIDYYKDNESNNLGTVLTFVSYYRIIKEHLKDYDRYLSLVKSDDYSFDFSRELRGAFTALNRDLTCWHDNKIFVDLDSIPSKYLKIYEEARDFLNKQYYKIFDYEDEINTAIPSFKDRRRNFQISQERKRQEKIWEEEQRQKHQRMLREQEQQRRLAEQKRRIAESERRKREATKKKEEKDKSSSSNVRPPHSNSRPNHSKNRIPNKK